MGYERVAGASVSRIPYLSFSRLCYQIIWKRYGKLIIDVIVTF